MANRNLAKSLHTITALVNVARLLIDNEHAEGRACDVALAVDRAAYVLTGGAGLPDVYGLKAKAASQLAALVPSVAYSVEDSFHVHARG